MSELSVKKSITLKSGFEKKSRREDWKTQQKSQEK